jgi:DNA invertase Pin-like site-specific DNA recombinase
MDRSGRQRSIEEQHNENQQAADDCGVILGEPYEDKSISASRYSRKAREGFPRLLADLEHGRFRADELWLWESSRGSRRVGEWVTLIELCEQRQVKIRVTTHNRTYDPSNGRSSLAAGGCGGFEYESGKISARQAGGRCQRCGGQVARPRPVRLCAGTTSAPKMISQSPSRPRHRSYGNCSMGQPAIAFGRSP